MSFFSSGAVLQKCGVEILEVKEKKRQMFVLTAVINILFIQMWQVLLEVCCPNQASAACRYISSQ